MRIAQVVTYISDDGAFGGPVAVALAQSIELARAGHRVHLYAAWDGKAQVSAPGVTLHLFRVAHPRFGLAAIVSARLVLALRRRRDRFDAVHLHFGRDLISLSAWLVAEKRRVVLQPHGMVMPDNRVRAALIDRLVVRRALRGAKRVLALTTAEAEGLGEVAGTRIVVQRVDNGLSIPAKVRFERPAPAEVLFLARLHPRKQVMVFAEAARRLLESGSAARFRVVGPDEGDLPELLAFIAEHKLEAGLRYDGSVGPGAGQRELAHSALLVLPSTGEVYPMTVLEAIAVGTPVVLSSDCGLSELLAPARAAIVVDPQPDQVAAAIAEVLSDETERQALALRAHQFALTSLSIEAVARQLQAVYLESLNTRAPRVAITQPYVPEYRGALWTSVIETLADAGIEARVFWGGASATLERVATRGDLTTPVWSTRVPAWELKWSRKHPPFTFRRLPRGWRRPEVLLTEMQATNLNAWASALGQRRFVTMGHGVSGTTSNSRLANLSESLQNCLASHALVYTPAGQEAVMQLAGIRRDRVTSFDNSTDTEYLRAAMEAVTAESVDKFRAVHDIPASRKIAMYLGALETYKRIDLLESAARLVLSGTSDWHLVVAGDGPERGRLTDLAKDTGRVTLLGRVGPDVYAPAAREAVVLLNPGRIGLVAVDALTMAITLLTTEGAEHAPEFSYLEQGRDVITAPASAAGFAAAWRSMEKTTSTLAVAPFSAIHSADIIAKTLIAQVEQARRLDRTGVSKSSRL